MKKSIIYSIVFSLFFVTLSFGQKAKNDNKFEIPNNTNTPEKKIYKQNTVLREHDGVTIALYGISEEADGNTPEDKVLNFLEKKAVLFGLPKNFKQDLTYHATSTGPAGTVVRYRQNYKKIPVEGSEITVTLDNNGTIVSVLNGYKPINKEVLITPKKTPSDAKSKLNSHFGFKTEHNFFKNDIAIVFQNDMPILAHKISLMNGEVLGDWQSFINGETGDIIEVKDIASYQTGNIFNPDPISPIQGIYGTGGFIDNNDENSPDLQARLIPVSLTGLRFFNGLYELCGQYAKIVDFYEPKKGLFSQASPSFNFNRKDDGFEAVMCYYHISKSMEYLKNTLGLTVIPRQTDGPVIFDPHGVDGGHNAIYHTLNGVLELGGENNSVDFAEDADVILHELGHGIHDWLSSGGLSNNDGLSEGCGDYWAQSYSRSLNQWTFSNPQFHALFNWGGRSPLRDIRRYTNSTVTYSQGQASGDIYVAGLVFASALMRVYDKIGKYKTDRMLWEGIRMTNKNTTQPEAAAQVYQAAINMNYSWDDLCVIYNSFVQAGYNAVPPGQIPYFIQGGFFPSHTGSVAFSGTSKPMTTVTNVTSTSFTVNLLNVSACTWTISSGTAYYFTPNSTGTSVNIQIPTNGSVTFALKTTTSCVTNTSYRTFKHSSSSWRNNGGIYPNPFTNSLSIELYKDDGNVTNDYLNVENRGNSYDNEFFNDANILIYDQNAKLIRRFTHKNIENTINLNLSDLQYGIYFIEIQQGLYIRREKIIKGQ